MDRTYTIDELWAAVQRRWKTVALVAGAILAISALVFGVAFFAVVASTTAFVRFNYPLAAWPTGIAAMTIAFGIGQTLGPIAVGAVTDAFGSLSYALNVSAAMLALGAIAAAFQGRLVRTTNPVIPGRE